MGAPFDALAEGYDAGFTHSHLGRLLRQAVWRRLDACFGSGDRVLELGCGTGEDAVHLARRGVRVTGLDASSAMVELAQRKARQHGVGDQVDLHALDVETWAAQPVEPAFDGPFDGVLSNFGVLNCVANPEVVASALARRVRPGGRVILVTMGPWVPWEWVLHLLRGAPRTAFRRLRRGGVPWRGLTVRYPTPGDLLHHFAPAFRRRRLSALGALLPPSEGANLVHRYPRLFGALAVVEQRLGRCWPLPWLADHHILELERVAP